MIEKGRCYLVKTTTLYYVGKVREITPMEVMLDQASEVLQTGNITQALGKQGTLKELEYVGDGVIVPRMPTIFIPWNRDLPSGHIL